MVNLQLVDWSIKYPSRVLENVTIRVGKFYLLVNFIVLKIEEDAHVLIILARPFSATAKVIMDLKNGKLTFEIGQEKVKFNVFQLAKQPCIMNLFYKINVTKKHVKEIFKEKFLEDTSKSYHVNNNYTNHKDAKKVAHA